MLKKISVFIIILFIGFSIVFVNAASVDVGNENNSSENHTFDNLEEYCSKENQSNSLLGNFNGGVCAYSTTHKSEESSVKSLFQTIKNVIDWFMVIAFVLAILLILRAGVLMLFSFGDVEKYKKGKSLLLNAVLGIGLLAISFGLVEWVFSLTGVSDLLWFN